MKAIVYVSETGYTYEYAKMLSEKCGLPLYSFDDAKKSLEAGSEIVYFAWLMAGGVVNCKKALKRWNVKAVCATGLSTFALDAGDVRKSNRITEDAALFLLPGGYAPNKLRGFKRLIMKIVTKSMIKALSEKNDRSELDNKMLEVLKNGGSFVEEKYLEPVVAFAQLHL